MQKKDIVSRLIDNTDLIFYSTGQEKKSLAVERVKKIDLYDSRVQIINGIGSKNFIFGEGFALILIAREAFLNCQIYSPKLVVILSKEK